ncbi:MAG TPA: NRDE family protein [Flavobacterium sp.]|nr:NRDE family protein [Flavobacterium sp.]
MCTLTFFPLAHDKFVLTTNRDEQPERKTIPPMEYNHNGTTLIYPKDQKAGGTWVGANSKGRVASLMNGGKTPHIRKESYRLSRGVVMTELLQANDVLTFLKTFDFRGIEPFTLVLIDPQNESNTDKFKAYELIWDEEKLHLKTLPWETQIWSSTPLYTRKVHQNRIKWLQQFMKETPKITPDAIWDFHHTAGNGDKTTDFIMDRGFIHTKSITQFVNDGMIVWRYEDFGEGVYTSQQKTT